MTHDSPRPFKPWRLADVVDVEAPAFALRTYLEQAELRRYLTRAAAGRRLGRAAELGCGYGRLLPVLSEFSDRVTGFERQPEFVALAAKLHPSREIVRIGSLTRLPVPDGVFDFLMTFTVLQHLTDRVAARAAAELGRLRAPGGHVLICEETDEGHRGGDVGDDDGICTIGRSVERYAALLSPLRLLETSPRVIEPTYARDDVGTYMLFGD
jgi:SAM-dependent methyltransferase